MRVWIDPGPRRRAQPHRGRHRPGAARAERPGRRPARSASRLRRQRPCAFQLNVETQGRLEGSGAVRPGRHPHRCRRPPGARLRRRARSSSAPRTIRSTPISRTSRPCIARASSSVRARTRSPLPHAVQARDGGAVQELPQGPRISRSSTTRPSSSHQSIDAVIETLVEAVPARRARHPRLPAEVARGDHPGARHPGVADRHLGGAGRGSATRSTTSRCSGWCWRSASSSTTRSSWSRMSSATSRRA